MKVVKGESTFTVNVCLSAVYTSVAMSHSKGSSTDYHVGTVVGGVSCLQEQCVQGSHGNILCKPRFLYRWIKNIISYSPM